VTGERSQSERFSEAARDAECNEDEAHWEDRLRQIAKQKPRDKKPAEKLVTL